MNLVKAIQTYEEMNERHSILQRMMMKFSLSQQIKEVLLLYGQKRLFNGSFKSVKG